MIEVTCSCGMELEIDKAEINLQHDIRLRVSPCPECSKAFGKGRQEALSDVKQALKDIDGYL